MSFSKGCSNFTEICRKRLAYTAKTATQSVFNDAQTPVSKGGRMRVDTNFLRASAVAKVGGIPSGQSVNPDKSDYNSAANSAGDNVYAQILRWVPGRDAIFIGWTANYARYREYQDGYMRGAILKWGEYVRKAAKEAQEKIR